MRKSSKVRPRLVIEVIDSKVVTIIVAIGERGAEKAELPKDLEYIVFWREEYGYPIVYDARSKAIYVIDQITESMIVEGRLRYDFWLAVRDNAYKQVRKAEPFPIPRGTDAYKRFKHVMENLLTP
jgi:hypothetical protein